ncbi:MULTISPECIES: hypothetical protein [unclassified Sphingomonas]|nr:MULTISPECIES: hypothetical protein [unclassified Sphingomonas]
MTTDIAALCAELTALLEKSTPGPWEAFKGIVESDELRCGISAMRGKVGYLVATIENGAPGDFCETEFSNALLVAAARTHLPTLLTALTAAQETIRRQGEALEGISTMYSRKGYSSGDLFMECVGIARAALGPAGDER